MAIDWRANNFRVCLICFFAWVIDTGSNSFARETIEILTAYQVRFPSTTVSYKHVHLSALMHSQNVQLSPQLKLALAGNLDLLQAFISPASSLDIDENLRKNVTGKWDS